jgi:hypothetical protein
VAEQTRGEGFVMTDASPKPGALSFIDFLVGLASSALIHMGAPHPETGERSKDLVLARQTLELLSMLREKTRGNLTPEEETFFDNLLTDLRFQFVEAQK